MKSFILLRLHQVKIVRFDIHKIANEFTAKKDSRKVILVCTI